MSDLPIDLSEGLDERLARCLDVEGKIPRALEALGPIAGRDVLLLGSGDGLRAGQLRKLGARVALAEGLPSGFGVADASADVVVSFWSSFRGAAPAELAEAGRALRPGGRLLVVHDYGRDDVSHLRAPRPELRLWSRPGGPFLGDDFKIRVLHCYWTFDSTDDCTDFLVAAFGDAGQEVAVGLKRPRLSYKIAIYHRTFGEVGAGMPAIVPTAALDGARKPPQHVPAGSGKAAG